MLQSHTLTDGTDNMRLGRAGSDCNLAGRYAYRYNQHQKSHLAGTWLALWCSRHLVNTRQSFVVGSSKAAKQVHGRIALATEWLLSIHKHTYHSAGSFQHRSSYSV